MKIIIPMTGYGSRFIAAGYKELKPFIKVQGKPVIEWIVKGMYAGETDFLFVCRKDHLNQDAHMEEKLLTLAPKSTIYAIENWVKKGPVFDVLCAGDQIDNHEPCIINYCDFYMTWDWSTFKDDVTARGCEGCVPCYTGFHPNLLPEKNLYASCLTDEEDNLIEIKEKFSFETDKTKAKHSPGVYYFKTGKILKKYCQALVDSGQEINGEYYASMPFNFIVRDGGKVWIPTNVKRFCQWGTPEDLKDYLFWTDHIRRYCKA